MGGTLNQSTLVVTPSMTGEDVLVVDNARLVEISEHGEGGWNNHSNRNGHTVSCRR
jgi:hypothetical protein